MSWEYTFEWAENEREAKERLSRLDREGWEALSYSGGDGGPLALFLRRRVSRAAVDRVDSNPSDMTE